MVLFAFKPLPLVHARRVNALMSELRGDVVVGKISNKTLERARQGVNAKVKDQHAQRGAFKPACCLASHQIKDDLWLSQLGSGCQRLFTWQSFNGRAGDRDFTAGSRWCELSRSLSPLCDFLVIHLSVDSPDVVLGRKTIHDVFDSDHCSQHGVILIVVFVHAVAANHEEIGEAVGVIADDVEAVIVSGVSGVGLGNADNGSFNSLEVKHAQAS